MALEIFHIFLVFNVFNFISLCVATVESHSQAFIQTDNELRYMVDDGVPLHVIPGQNIQEISVHDGSLSPSPIRFEPPLLDFQDHPVGMPHMEQVTVHNPDTQNSLHLLSISGSTLHFHCSFFQDKMVPPGGNTTFDVVFLARQVGNVENTLYIHTSQGSFKYQVFGVGVPNPYRIRPFLGAKVPVNSSFSPLIKMHNPHSSTLQVVEMYSSGGDLHLELPTGEKEAPKNLWEIPPYETKPVMRASFIGRIENNHTAFIRIKTNREKKDEVLILPVEVEVTAAAGLFSPLEMLDFGILRTLDGPKTLRLNLINSGTKAVHIQSVSVFPPNDAVNIEFRPIKLQPQLAQATPIALISYSASKAIHPKQWSGQIIVKSKNGVHKIAIAYQANVLHGSLVYDTNKTKFYSGKPPFENITRELWLTNTFNFTLVLYNVSLPPQVHKYFSILNLNLPMKLGPQQSVLPFKVKFHPNCSGLHLSTEMSVYTNASVFHVPLIVYNGNLKVVHHRPEIFKGQLDFGTMGVEERRSMTFTLRNDNPVDIVIREFGANMEKTFVELLGVEKGNGTTLTRKHNSSDIETNPLVLKPYHFAVFRVNLIAPNYEGTFAAEVIIVTQFENLYIPMTLRTAEGSLNAIPEKIVFDKVFPGKLPYKVLKIRSTFDNYMEVREITFQPNDTRFYYEHPKQKPVTLEPQRDTVIGKLYFDAKSECSQDCYIGLPTYIPAGHQWLLGVGLDKEVADTDQYLYTRFQQKWQLLGQQQLNTINVTLQLDTNQVRGFLFPAQAHLHWPSLTKRLKIKFPLTQIGNTTVSDFILENPADVPVLMQILPLSLYPNPQTIVDMVSPSVSSDLTSDLIETDDLDIFTLQDLETHNPGPNNPIPGLRKRVEQVLGVKPHKHTVTAIVQAATKIRVRVGFQPKDDISRTSLIIIRNNLTIMDAVVVQGQGGRGNMRFSNRKAGSQSPLLFEMTEKHLKNCDRKKQSKSIPPNFTVKRTFTARNTGELPFYVHGFSINESPCEGYGFRVLDCRGFELLPNASKKIDIAFTPDFTMSRIRRTLLILTSLGPSVNYTLQATVPANLLSKCASVLPRPSWEPILYYSVICVMGFLLFCTLVAGYFEADRILTADIIKRKCKVTMATQTFDKSKVFDLKTIAGVKSESKVNSGSKPPTPEIANGHVEHLPKKEVSSLRCSLQSLLHTYIFSRLTSHENRQQLYERPSSQDKEIKSNIPSHIHSTDKSDSQFDSNLGSDGTTSFIMRAPRAKTKAAKRPNNADLINEAQQLHLSERKQSNKDITTNHRKLIEQENRANLEKERAFIDQKCTNYKKLDKSNMIPMLDTFDTAEVCLANNEDTDNGLDGSSCKDGKKVKRKPKMVLKREEKERRQKEKLKRKEIADNERDETSSTTTESSGLEADEKNSSARESTPEPLPLKTRKVKNRTKKDKKKYEQTEEDEAQEEEFMLTSRSRAHKRIKVDPKNAFGGNILRPSTLELPYTTKLEAAKGTELKVEPTSPHAIAAEAAAKALKKNIKTNKQKGLDVCPMPTCGDTDSSDSPPPQWDFCNIVSGTGDLAELSLQTEQFDRKHNKHLLGMSTLSPDPLTSSSRSSSYSSIVSNSSGDHGSASRLKHLKGWTNAADAASKQPGFPVIPDVKQLGAIGSKSVGLKSNSMRPMPKTAWPVAPGSPTASDISVHSFGLHPIQEGQRPVMLTEEDILMGFSDPPLAAADNMVQYGFSGAGGAASFDQQPATLMQRLLADRRKRLLEYQQKVLQGEDWPGFDIPAQQESLWDPTTAPTETWSTITDSPPRHKMSNALWEPLSAGTNAGWNGVSSIWSTNDTGITDNGMLDPSSTAPSLDSSPERQNLPSPVGGFDPFNTLGSIWKPSGGSGGVSNWRFTPKPDEEDE